MDANIVKQTIIRQLKDENSPIRDYLLGYKFTSKDMIRGYNPEKLLIVGSLGLVVDITTSLNAKNFLALDAFTYLSKNISSLVETGMPEDMDGPLFSKQAYCFENLVVKENGIELKLYQYNLTHDNYVVKRTNLVELASTFYNMETRAFDSGKGNLIDSIESPKTANHRYLKYQIDDETLAKLDTMASRYIQDNISRLTFRNLFMTSIYSYDTPLIQIIKRLESFDL